jgi:hypothetical protein
MTKRLLQKTIETELFGGKALFNNVTSGRLKSFFGNNKIVVVDAAQRIKNVGVKFKLITDKISDIQLMATGSSSFELANKINGTKKRMHNYPLPFTGHIQIISFR